MAVTLNAKGTSFSSFTVGKGGATIYQGTTVPDIFTGISGDLYIYINGSSSELYQNLNGTWTILAGGDVTGPASSTANSIAVYSDTSGTKLNNTSISIDSNNTLSIVKNNSAAKKSEYLLWNSSTGSTSTQLYLDGSTEQLVLTDNTTIYFDIDIVGRMSNTTGTNMTAKFSGSIARDSGAASTSLLGDISQGTNITPSNLNWNINISADSTNGALRIDVTGSGTNSVSWGASVRTLEINA